jgi:hypothetical protein
MQFYENKRNSSIFKETSKIQSKNYTKFKGTRLEIKIIHKLVGAIKELKNQRIRT